MGTLAPHFMQCSSPAQGSSAHEFRELLLHHPQHPPPHTLLQQAHVPVQTLLRLLYPVARQGVWCVSLQAAAHTPGPLTRTLPSQCKHQLAVALGTAMDCIPVRMISSKAMSFALVDAYRPAPAS